jgi:hypothetical protein
MHPTALGGLKARGPKKGAKVTCSKLHNYSTAAGSSHLKENAILSDIDGED